MQDCVQKQNHQGVRVRTYTPVHVLIPSKSVHLNSHIRPLTAFFSLAHAFLHKRTTYYGLLLGFLSIKVLLIKEETQGEGAEAELNVDGRAEALLTVTEYTNVDSWPCSRK